VGGKKMAQIREESRQIYMVGGDTPDLEKSKLFRDISAGSEKINLHEYLFPSKDLSIKPYDYKSLEEKIEISINKFKEEATKLFPRGMKKGQIRNNIENKKVHEIVQESESVLSQLYDTVHVNEFLIQQNRDIYRELCHYACSKLKTDEISKLMKTRWNQELDRCLFANEMKSTIDYHMLGCLVEQFFNVIILNKDLSRIRDFQKELRIYKRQIVKGAREEMKINNDLAWKRFPGWYNIESVKGRKELLEENLKKFHTKTDLNKLYYDFTLHRSSEKDLKRRSSIAESERWADVMDDDKQEANNLMEMHEFNDSDVKEYIYKKFEMYKEFR